MMDWSINNKIVLKCSIEGMDGYWDFHGSLCKHVKLSTAFDPRVAETRMDKTNADGVVDAMALEKYENKEGVVFVLQFRVNSVVYHTLDSPNATNV